MPQDTASNELCILPGELEREIFELAASESLQIAARLTLVARRVREWIEPSLYRIFRANRRGRVFPPFCLGTQNSTLDMPRLMRYGQHIRHVVLREHSARSVRKILDRCPNVENLALWIVDGSCAPLVPVLEALPLKRLSVDALDFLLFHGEEMVDVPITLNITHLDINNFGYLDVTEWEQITSLPELTHLFFNGCPRGELLENLLHKCVKLELLVLFIPWGERISSPFQHGHGQPKIRDKRLVKVSSIVEYEKQWELGTLRGGDFWKIYEEKRDSARLDLE
ncbi:hypothetical protein BDZ97DRAFT_1757117 [Flammula alnicola]|nr:hypothetical protein BDZ97DRAFT_1757117 [Flammula alnicola]